MVASAGLYSTAIFSSAKLTLADRTPGKEETALSTLLAQAAQFIPVILNDVLSTSDKVISPTSEFYGANHFF
jgi:hypothetical protein